MVPSSLFDEILHYLDFNESDQAALRALHPLAQPHFVDMADRFYERIQAHPQAAAILRSEAQVKRLKATLVRWMDRLLAGPWDDDYFQARLRIGRVHVEIRLPQHYMFTAMGLIQSDLHRIAHDLGPGAHEAIEAVDKITNIDVAIMLESYRHDYVAVIRDYAKAKQDSLEQKLALSEARYLAVFENAAAAIMAIDADGKITLFNRQVEEATDYLRSRVLGMDLVEMLCHPADADVMRSNLEEALRGNPVTPFESRLITANRQQIWFRWHLTTIPAGQSYQACAIGIEVTQEHELAARTRRAETLAALGTLAAGLAHEIRNPLNAAQLQLMLVDRSVRKLGDAAPERALNAAQMVRDELGRLAGLVEDFLAYARPTSLRIQNVDVCAVVKGVIDLLLPDAEKANVALIACPSDDVVARIDDERMKQVLLNLVRNGIEAAGDGGKVEVHCYRVAQTVLIEVIDDGKAGLPENVDIFEPFTTSKESGTGLGLPIVHRIISDHGGDIRASRKDGRTYFTAELPVDGPMEHPTLA